MKRNPATRNRGVEEVGVGARPHPSEQAPSAPSAPSPHVQFCHKNAPDNTRLMMLCVVLDSVARLPDMCVFELGQYLLLLLEHGPSFDPVQMKEMKETRKKKKTKYGGGRK